MKRFMLAILVLGILVAGQAAQAAIVPQLVQEVDIVADKSVTPLDYSFFDQPAPGRLELSNVKNLWGAGAQMTFYVETNTGPDYLMLNFGGGMVEIKLQQRKLALFSERMSAISGSTPLVLTIKDEKLTATIGNRSRTIDNVSAFKGGLTTQSIEGKLKAYQFVEQ